MNVFLYQVLTSLFFLLHGIQMYSMTTTLSRVPARTAKAGKALEKRPYFTPQAMHKMNKPIKKTQLEKFNLGHGLALIESQTLPNLYEAAKTYKAEQQQEVPVLFQLVKKMFHRVMANGEITITKSIGNVPTFITPTIMGILTGSIESGELEKGRLAFNIAIAEQWDGDPEVEKHRQGLENDKERKKYDSKFKKDIDVFFDMAVKQSKVDSDALNSILLAFLYKKIHHDSPDQEFHDWMDFLANINEYIPVFSNEELDAAHKKLLQTSDIPSSFESAVFGVKSMVVFPRFVSSSTYTHFFTNNFPLVLSDIIEKIRAHSVYPPIVTSGVFGYKDQPKKADCVETATREILFNFFYDNVKKKFDTLKYPALSISPELKNYLAVCNPDNMNTVPMGQLFFDMVSDRGPSIRYTGRRNYEMLSDEHNILTILTLLLGIDAADWNDLAKELTKASNNAMEITCKSSKASDGTVIIDITIADKDAKIIRSLTLNISKGHSFVVSQAEKSAKQKINLEYLLQQDSINPQIKSIFYLSPASIDLQLSEEQRKGVGSLLYHSWPVRTQDEKIEVIKTIAKNYAQDDDAMNYAYGIFKSLNPSRMELLFNISLLKMYCNDQDREFIDQTKDVFLQTMIQGLNTLLKKISFSEVKKLLFSVVDEQSFNAKLIDNSNLLMDLLERSSNNDLFAYVIENNPVIKSAGVEFALTGEIIHKLKDKNFIQSFYSQYPSVLYAFFNTTIAFAENDSRSKYDICHLLLRQNIDLMDPAFQLHFYKKIFPSYISLLLKKYGNIVTLGDIRPRVKQYPELYKLYDTQIIDAAQKDAYKRNKRIVKE